MCDAKIRPFIPVNEMEVYCQEKHDYGLADTHQGTLKNYAYPGSKTTMVWMEDDRRNFHGEWPGRCEELLSDNQCVLPKEHRGNHVDGLDRW